MCRNRIEAWMTPRIEEGRHRDFVAFHVDDADHSYGFQYVGQRVSEGLPGILTPVFRYRHAERRDHSPRARQGNDSSVSADELTPPSTRHQGRLPVACTGCTLRLYTDQET